jgi:hypothetical protein
MSFFSENRMGLGDPWFETVMELREGRFPSREALEFGLRSKEPMPEAVREFLADFLTGKAPAPIGRPKISWLEREITGRYVRVTHEHIKMRQAYSWSEPVH